MLKGVRNSRCEFTEVDGKARLPSTKFELASKAAKEEADAMRWVGKESA